MTDLFGGLEWRLNGPFRGGRVVAVAADWQDPRTFYFGSTGGGVWKTTDGGVYWENVSDGYFKRSSVGALAVARSDSNVIYAGMGESCIRGNVSHGDGVYRSTDAGKTWQHRGLTETRHISRVRVHPSDPDLVYVAALGHAHGPNPERGVFRSKDGGASWEHVLSRGPDAGASDLSMDPFNPRVLYAALWQARRLPWRLDGGGPGSGLFRSTDGGETWTEISRNRGLPKGVLGKIGISASAARRDRLYAIVEAEDGAVFRSDDAGESWERAADASHLRQRAWYYQHVFADPSDAETVWVFNIEAYRSNDGGRTFNEFAIPHGDNHDLWIDPNDPRRMIAGNDGGALVSFNAGATWSSIYNQPTAEMYHVTTDTRTPYRVYGAQQDNTTISVPSRSALAAIHNAENIEIGGGESGYIAVRPDDPDVILAGSYLGYLTRYDRRTGQARDISVWPEDVMGGGARDAKYRFQWTFPIVISRHDPNVLYVTGNHVFRSTDEGASWESISPDLTRNDPTKQESSGGPLTQDNTGAEYYGTVFSFAESPLAAGVLWAGSDDGMVHVSRDGGASWQCVTPPGLPQWTTVNLIEASPHDTAAAYAVGERHRLDDFGPYLFKTSDYGATWTRIDGGLDPNVFLRALREDPRRRGLLYLGTETGLMVSFDDGATWQSMQGNLPVVPIHDLQVKEPEGDLVLATHGRSFWVLDDLGVVRQLAECPAVDEVKLIEPRPTVRYMSNVGFGSKAVPGSKNYRMPGPLMVTFRQVEDPRTGEKVNHYLDAAKNPPDGVIVAYYLPAPPETDITLTFLDQDGHEIRTFSSYEPKDEAEKKKKHDPRIPKEAGLNRFVWDLRYPDATRIEDDELANELVQDAIPGPRARPGGYRVRLQVGDQTREASFDVVPDPRVGGHGLNEQFELASRVHARLSEVHAAVNQLRALRRRAEDWKSRADDNQDLAAAATNVIERLKPIELALIMADARGKGDDLARPARLNNKLARLAGVISSADAAPTRQSRAVFDELSRRVDAQLQALDKVVASEVADLNRQIREADLPVVGAWVPRR